MPRFRFYARQLPGLPIEKQIASAYAAGLSKSSYAPLYSEKRGAFPRQRDEDFLPSFRKAGEAAGVARLAVLAADRRDLKIVLAKLRQGGCTEIIETDTGRRIGLDDADMILDAIDYWARTNKTFANVETAAQAGARGGKRAAQRRRDERMPAEAAIVIWRDTKRYTTDQAVEAINSDTRYLRQWSAASLHRELGKRGGKVGRRPSAKVARTYEG